MFAKTIVLIYNNHKIKLNRLWFDRMKKSKHIWENTMDKFVLQAKLDKQKWDDSVINHRDMCGAYDYCAFCDKSIAMPCATAFEKMNEPKLPHPCRKKSKTSPNFTLLSAKNSTMTKSWQKKPHARALPLQRNTLFPTTS